MLAMGCYWGANDHRSLWTQAVEQLAAGAPTTGATTWYIGMHRYPALLALYAAGLGALAAGHEEAAIRVMIEPKVMTTDGEQIAGAVINPAAVLEPKAMEQLPDLDRRKTPSSDHVLDHLTPVFQTLVPDARRFENLFDRFEYLLALAVIGHAGQARGSRAPVGRYGWKQERYGFSLLKDVEAEAKQAGTQWPMLRLGLFGGSLDNLLSEKAEFDKFLAGRWGSVY